MSDLVSFPLDVYRSHAQTAFDAFPTAPEFSVRAARALMWFSQLAYEAERADTIDEVKTLWGFDRITPFVERMVSVRATFQTCGILGEGHGAVLLAFGGTDPLVWENLATDFNIRIGRDGDDVHAGFRAAAAGARVQDMIDSANEASRRRGLPLFMMGHSLGAAVAALAAEQASDRGNPPTSVYVYGMPRIGSSQFKARYDTKLGDRTYRLVHGRDLVAAVPPPSLGFAHVGRLLRCGPGDKFDAAGTPASPGSDQPTLAPQVLESIKGQFLALRSGHLSSPVGPGRFGALFRLLPPSIRDHLQDRYLNALGANISF